MTLLRLGAAVADARSRHDSIAAPPARARRAGRRHHRDRLCARRRRHDGRRRFVEHLPARGAQAAQGAPPPPPPPPPLLGYYRSFSVEGVASLKPNLVLASDQSGPPQAFEQLQRLGNGKVVGAALRVRAGGAGPAHPRRGRRAGQCRPGAPRWWNASTPNCAEIKPSNT